MSESINIYFVFPKQNEMVELYSNWGGYNVDKWLSAAIAHAKPRWDDDSYATRMVISHILYDSILDETGWGISAKRYFEEGDNGYRMVDWELQKVITSLGDHHSFNEYVRLFNH